MKPFWGLGSACALLLVAGSPADAAWNSVFQVCCNTCRSAPAVSNYYAAPAAPSVSYYNGGGDACCPQPQPVCTTRYVQRCYYQPVTCYQTKSYYEPVTTYRTSYYYEPVTSYRYSCYYDPCTCSYQQVACPTTCYRLRSQCCPVQSWVQRCCQVPVTSYRIASYWEPVTSCCTPQAPACAPTATAAAPATTVPATPQPPLAAPTSPSVTEQRAPASAGVSEMPGAGGGSPTPLYDRYNQPGATPQQMPTVPNGTSRQIQPRAPAYLPPATPPAAPRGVRLDRIVSLPQSQLQGQVFLANAAPRGNARLVFVSASRQSEERTATADGSGKFSVSLAAGSWNVYVRDEAGQQLHHSTIDMQDNEVRQVTLLSR